MSNEQVSINAHEILLNNQNDEKDSHIVIRTTKTLGENDIELRTCNVKIKDGAMQTNKIVPFSGSNIDMDNNTLINATLGSGTSIPSGLINASDVGSDNYSGQTLDYELDTLQSNINAKLSTTGNTGNKFLTTTGAGTIQFSKNISDVVDLNTVQTITNKSIDATNNTVTNIPYANLTGTPTIPSNNNELTNGAGYITASSTDTLTNKSMSYSQLTGTPTIPTNNNELSNGAGYITASSTDTLTNKSISYSQITNQPTIPSNNNELTNGAGYITASSTDTLTNKSMSYSQLTGTPTIPTNNNELTNGAGYITASSTDTLTNKTITSGVLTTPQINDTSLDNKYIIGVSELTDNRTITLPLLGANDTFTFKNHTQTLTNKTLSGSNNTFSNIPYSALTGTPTIPTNNNELTNGSGYITASSTDTLTNKSLSYSQLTGTPTIPTNNNQLTNGANYMNPSSSAAMTNKVMSVDNDDYNDYQTTDGFGYGFVFGVNTSDEFTCRKNVNNSTTSIYKINFNGTPIFTFDNTPKIGSDNILHANDNISQLNNNSGYITASSTDTLTNKSLSYSQLTGTPTIPTNNNELTNGAGYITLSSSGNITNKSMEIPNGSYFLFKKNDTNNTDARIYYDTNDTFKIGNLLTDWISVSDTNVMTFGVTPKIGSDNILHANDNISQLNNNSGYITASSTDTITNKTIDFNNNTILNSTGGIQASDNTTFTGNNIFSGNVEFQLEVGIDEDDGASLEFNLTNGALPPQKCTTKLVSVQHQNTSGTTFTLSLPAIKSGQTADQLVGKDAIQTLTGKTMSGSSNTFSNIPYSTLTGTPTIPTNNNSLTNGAGYITRTLGSTTQSDFTFSSHSAGLFSAPSMILRNQSTTGGGFFGMYNDGGTTPNLCIMDTGQIITGNDDFTDTRNTKGIHIANGGGISFQPTTANSGSRGWRLRHDDTGDWGSMTFSVSDNNTSAPALDGAVFTITSGAKVGINDETPADYLTVRHGYSAGSTYRGIGLEENNGDIRWRTALTGASGTGDCYSLWYGSTGVVGVQLHASTTSYFNSGRTLGIGTSSVTSNVLDIRGAGSSDTMYIFSDHATQDFRWRFRYDEIAVQRETGTNNNTYGANSMYVNYNSGSVIIGGSAVTSDNRIKHNEVVVTDGIDIIKKLTPKKYFKSYKVYDENHNYDLDSSGNPITEDEYKIETGLIAQEILEIPEIKHLVETIPDKSRIEKKVINDSSGNPVLDEEGNNTYEEINIEVPERYTLNYQDIFVYNVEATKQLINKVETLEALVASLTSRLEALEN